MTLQRQSSHFRNVDRAMDGGLVEALGAITRQEIGAEEVARQLFANHGVVVTGQTLRRWARLSIDETTRAAS